MGISQELAARHIQEWSDRYLRINKKRSWPKHLFHLAQASTVANILDSGVLHSRSFLGEIEYDVADQGALNNNCASHEYCRFYFRPKNKFQLKREGIKPRDSVNRPRDGERQISIPIMLVYDAFSILTLPETRFTKESAARSNAVLENGDAAFSEMNFEYIYHDEATTSENRPLIHGWRMAEVLAPCGLTNEYLKKIICRTHLDKETLRSYLSPDVYAAYASKIIVEQHYGSTFLHEEAYIKELTVGADGLLYLTLKIASSGSGEYNVLLKRNGHPDKRWNLPRGNKFRLRTNIDFSTCQDAVEIYLEDEIAFRGYLGNLPSIL